jgi:hypothetical protein
MAESPFAPSRCYLSGRGLSCRVGRRYSSFIARTGSCARPKPSCRLRSSLFQAGLCRLSPVPAGSWPFPTLSPLVFPRMLGLVSRWGCRVLVPVSSPSASGLPLTLPEGRLPTMILRSNFTAGGISRPSPFLTFRPPGLLATLIAPTAAALPIPLVCPIAAHQLWTFVHAASPPRFGLQQGSCGFILRAERVPLPPHASD